MPGNKGPRTSGLLLWFACWLFTGDLCGCAAVLAVGRVLCTAVLMWYSDVAALSSRTRWIVAVRAFDSLSIFSAQLFDFGNRFYRKGGVQKARSVRSFAAQLNLTNNSDRSSLVQLYFMFVHVDGSTSTSTSPSVRNQGIGRISDKRKISVSWKIRIKHCKRCCNTIPAVSLRLSLLCFLRGIVFGTQTLWIHVFV